MRVKLDENLPVQLKDLFTEAGHDAATVVDVLSHKPVGAHDADDLRLLVGSQLLIVGRTETVSLA